jgi:hypothetical protein
MNIFVLLRHFVTVTKYLKGQLKRSKDLFWHIVSVHGQQALLFLGCGEAEQHGGEGVGEQIWPEAERGG